MIFFFVVMANEDEDVPNWMLDDTSVLSQKFAKIFTLLVWNM